MGLSARRRHRHCQRQRHHLPTKSKYPSPSFIPPRGISCRWIRTRYALSLDQAPCFWLCIPSGRTVWTYQARCRAIGNCKAFSASQSSKSANQKGLTQETASLIDVCPQKFPKIITHKSLSASVIFHATTICLHGEKKLRKESLKNLTFLWAGRIGALGSLNSANWAFVGL